MSIVYNKLVRDKIPEIIEASGKTAVVQLCDLKTYQHKLAEKLLEEAQEYKASGAIEELADIAEVFDALLQAHNLSIETINQERHKKNASRGAFEKRLVLIEVK